MSIRVVIADDHPVVRDGMRLAIERRGREIVIIAEASDGMEVLEFAGMTPIDVFILDITMPKMNGIETARELIGRLPGAKIIMLSPELLTYSQQEHCGFTSEMRHVY